MLAHEGGEKARQPERAVAGHRADDQLATVEVGELLHLFLSGLDFFKDPIRAGKKRLASFGQGQIAPATLEQAHAQLLFEQLDLLGERGLRHIQLVGGAAEAADPSDVAQVLKLAELHLRRWDAAGPGRLAGRRSPEFRPSSSMASASPGKMPNQGAVRR